MRTRRGTMVLAADLKRALLTFSPGDIVTAVAVGSLDFIGKVTRVDAKCVKVFVDWGGGVESQHDPDELRPSPFVGAEVQRNLSLTANRRVKGTDVPHGDQYVGDPKLHGIDKPRGGGFSIMQDLQKDLAPESRSEAKDNPKTADEDVFKKHQKNIAIKTLKMNDVFAKVMGGMTKEEARDFLKSIGWSEGKIRQLEASDNRSRTAAAGPHTLMQQLLDDFKAGKLEDDEMLQRWGHGMGHTKGADYVIGAGEDIIWALLAYASGRREKKEVLDVIGKNIQQAVKDNELFEGLRGEERETHDRWMTYMKGKRGSISAAKKINYRGYTIEESGSNYYVTDPSGHRAFGEVPASVQTAKKWIDLEIHDRGNKASSVRGRRMRGRRCSDFNVAQHAVLGGSLRTARDISSVSGQDVLNAYDLLYGDFSTQKEREEKGLIPPGTYEKDVREWTVTFDKWVAEVRDAVQSDDLDTFKRLVSLNRTNYSGKKTRALLYVLGIRQVRNLDDLFGQMFGPMAEGRSLPSDTLWLRTGDTGSYEQYGEDFSAVADALVELGINPDEMRQIRHGVVAPGFASANYISLYWGDKNSENPKDLSRNEFQEIQRLMRRVTASSRDIRALSLPPVFRKWEDLTAKFVAYYSGWPEDEKPTEVLYNQVLDITLENSPSGGTRVMYGYPIGGFSPRGAKGLTKQEYETLKRHPLLGAIRVFGRDKVKSYVESHGIMRRFSRVDWASLFEGVTASSFSGLRSRRALYWGDKGRVYRLTRTEQENGVHLCPKCKKDMEQEPFTKSERLVRCPECGFKIPTSKLITERPRVEVEVSPDGDVEVEVEASIYRRGMKAAEVPENLSQMSISEIAALIASDWARVYFGAKPYLDAMFSLRSIDDNYMMDSGRSIVAYFLANATTWRGEVAKAVKKELNRRLK